MGLEKTFALICKEEKYNRLLGELNDGRKPIVLVSSCVRPYILASLYSSVKRPLLIITFSSERASRLVADLRAFSVEAYLFPEAETMLYDSLSPSPASVGRRFSTLDSMASERACAWVTTVQASMRIVPPVSEAIYRPLRLKIGDAIDLYELASELVSMGYMRVPLVEGPGQFGLRGGIIDVFSSDAELPIRIEFFGDEIDSIRTFGVSSQRSVDQLREVKIYGCRQVVLTEENTARAVYRLSSLNKPWLEEEIGRLKEMQYFEGIEKYLPFLYEGTSTILDYLPAGYILVVDEPEETEQSAKRYFEQQQAYVDHLITHQVIVKPPSPYFKNPAGILKRDGAKIELTSIGGVTKDTINFQASPVQPMVGRVEQLIDMIKDCTSLDLKVVISLHDEGQLMQIAELLSDWKIPYSTDAEIWEGVNLVIGNLSGGFVSPDIGIAVISFYDIFGRHSDPQKVRSSGGGRAISDVADLKIGDYVVHSSHGIAIYGGLKRREVAGVIRDYAVLEYAGSDRLFVPTDQLNRITRYIGSAGDVPTVSRLGGSEWLKAKRKAKASAKKVAYDLLSLYAERAKANGFSFSPDSPWQKELEDSFQYEETSDQLAAINDVKRDMEGVKPMDRLICGDVGYGKTEVAVRATFKAVMDGKQVLVLVPTTILAQQHFTTFNERLSPFPVNIDMVSRFKSRIRQREIIARLNEGSLDVLIGTHRLLQSDVKPFNLGLVIIDEEQRFGVNDKEKMRHFKKTADTLTLSATPIPRTLQMSLAGVRDMSVIETPPEDRHPIVTHVGRYDEEMMAQAIRRELGRGGQIYYVHNRVETISRMATRIKTIIPEARVAVAHGQMSEHQLEKVMLAFLKGEYDVLICTTIIESGIDIPRVNTLIVDRAENLGLAQLYQLRGRVGRSGQRAYAYFFFSPQILLTAQAFERLKTISDFTELGSGVKIALRDLEIRGAGNLLGPEQSGHMSAVGFDLYCQMLREAIEELEGKPIVDPLEVKIDLPVNAYLPDSYITEENLRIEAYKKIILSRSFSDIDDVMLELTDRYGTLPDPVVELLGIAKTRLLSINLGITQISYQGGKVKVSPIRLAKHQEMSLARSYNNLSFRSERQYLLISKLENTEIIAFLLALFSDIMGALNLRVEISQKAR
ncbi:MAG: transcription-repair coupling factor [Actinobacteria bacterium]|nr:transcription-repair coupling factor [Actinomycetota bacterium]